MPGAVLFDIDGTLVDSNYLHVTAWREAFLAVDRNIPTAAIHRCIGMDSAKLLERLLGPSEASGEVAERAKAEHKERYMHARPSLRAFDGAVELVRAVAGRATSVLATSAPDDELAVLRDILQVDDAVAVITSAGDVGSAKPDPDIVAVALERAGVDAGDAVFVGDTVWDVEAAGRAGVGCVALLSGGIGEAELRDAGAVEVFDGAAALLDGLDRSALARVLG
ncbi:MAG TPA: HAD family hydrolase [Acidimicrobiales bacterium]|nr:HAD family hydrolase [Acidimicrobiales bacterium]